MNEQNNSNSISSLVQQEYENYWNDNPDSILMFNATKREFKEALDEILIEYDALIKRMKDD